MDSVAMQHDNIAEINRLCCTAPFREKFDDAFERTNVVVVHGSECSSPSLLETGVESVEKVSLLIASMDVAGRNHNIVRVGQLVDAVLTESQQIVAKSRAV